MQHEILHPNGQALVSIKFSDGDVLKAEAGALVAKSACVHIEATTDGGAIKALKRSLLGGERFFFQTLRASGGNGEALIAPPLLGEIVIIEVAKGDTYYLESGSFLAAIGDIELDTKMQTNSKALLTGTGLFSIAATGAGTLFLSAFGGMHQIVVPADEEYAVDSGHIVAWQGETAYTVEKGTETWLASATSGELTICQFKGPAKVWIQTRNPYGFGHWMRKYFSAG